jgi:hypothetical protein
MTMMEEDPILIGMNISHYLALLTLDMDDQHRLIIEKLLGEARMDLVQATNTERRP